MLFFCLEKKNILPYLCFQLPHRPIFLVTTLKIFRALYNRKKKRQYQVCLWWNTAIHAISDKTLKTAVINTNTHIPVYKMKRKKKDRKK
jgi:hypothetical protein